MEEIYTLSDGTTIDISKYSQLERTKFFMENPEAKSAKKKGTATGEVVVPGKKKSPSMGSSSEKSSSVSKSKFRLPTEEEYEKLSKTFPKKPTYGVEPVKPVSYEDFYNLKSQIAEPITEKKKEISVPKSRSVKINGYVPKENWSTWDLVTEEKPEIKIPSDEFPTSNIDKTKAINLRLPTEEEYQVQKVKDNKGRIEAYIKQKKLDTPNIYESYDEGDDFASSLFDINDLASRNINISDLNGFLTAKGYKDDMKRFMELELDKSTYGQDYDPRLAFEKKKIQYLNAYVDEQIKRDIKRQKLDYEYKTQENPDFIGKKFKPGKFSANFDLSGYEALIKKEAPLLSAKMVEIDQQNLEKYNKLVKSKGNVGAGEFLGSVLENGWNGFANAVSDFSASAYGILPGDFFEGISESIREKVSLEEMSRGNDYRYVTANGYKTNVDGVDYIVDSFSGTVYDVTNKINVTNVLTDEQKNFIIKKAQDENVRDTSFSVLGSSYQAANVIGDLVFQLALTRASGTVTKAAGGFTEGLGVLGKTKSYLKSVPIKRSVADATIAQGTIGFSKGYEDTLKAAREAGIPDGKAKELASLASMEMGVWYAATAWINPQTKTSDMLFGKAKNEVLESAINAYVQTGKKGFLQTIRGYAKNFVDITGEGLAEVFQENIQQAGETFVINKDVNELAGQKLLKDTMSLQDFMDTTILSFVAGSLIPGAGAGIDSAKKTTRQLLGMQGVDRFNALNTLARNRNKVDDFLSLQVEQGIYTKQEADRLLEEIDAYNSTINKMPGDISAEAAENILGDIKQIADLEQKKKTTDKSFHVAIDEELDVVRGRVERAYYDDVTKKRTSTIKKLIQEGKVGDVEYREFDDQDNMIKVLMEEFNYSKKDAEAMSSNPGFILTPDILKVKLGDKFTPGKKVLFVNNTAAAEMSQFSVGKHEFLHGVIYETIKGDKEAQVLLGRALSNEILTLHQKQVAGLDSGIAAPTGFLKRFKRYVDKYSGLIVEQDSLLKAGVITEAQRDSKVNTYLANQWEEVLTLYSDAIDNGTVVFENDLFTRLGDIIRQVLQRLGIKNIEFNSGKDVYNFIKDYNSSVEKGTFGGILGRQSALEKVTTKGAEVNKESLEKQVGRSPLKKETKEEQDKDGFTTDAKFALKSDRSSQDKFKKEVNDSYDKDKWGFNYKPDGDRNYVERVLDDILQKYSVTIAQKAKGYGWTTLPDYSEYDLIAETQIALMPVIRNFNKEFFTLRQEYKQELEKRGLKEGTKEFKEALDEQDAKGYKGKKGIVKENNDLNAYINSLLRFKMYDALKTGAVTSQTFTSDIDDEVFKESSIQGFDYYETSEEMLDDIDTLMNEQETFEVEQSKLAVLLKDPIFGFVDEDGNPIEIETVPVGMANNLDIDDPNIPANKRLAKAIAEGNQDEMRKAKSQMNKLKRGLELEAKEAKEELTVEEIEELSMLKSFKSYNLSDGKMIRTYEAYSQIGVPAKILSEEIAREIQRAPNLETLEYRNFKDNLNLAGQTLVRRMTFKNGDYLNRFMYDNWELIYNVINNPTDPVSGESSYASKKLPPRLKQLDDDGKFIKVPDMTREKFLQSFFGDEDTKKIIRKYSKNPEAGIRKMEGTEINEATGKKITPQGYFDRRTALMELFADVLILQEARRLLRSESFIETIKDKRPRVYEDLKDDIKLNAVLNNMAKGKSDVVKFTLAKPENTKREDTTSKVVNEAAIKEKVIGIASNPINELISMDSFEDSTKYTLAELTSKKLENYNKKYEAHYKISDEGSSIFTSKKARDRYFEKEKKDYVKVLMLSDLKDQIPGTKLHTFKSFEEIKTEVSRRVNEYINSMRINIHVYSAGDSNPFLYVGNYNEVQQDYASGNITFEERKAILDEYNQIRVEQFTVLHTFLKNNVFSRYSNDSNVDHTSNLKHNLFYTYLLLQDFISNRYELDYNNKDVIRNKFKQSEFAKTRLPLDNPLEDILAKSKDYFYESDTLYPLLAYNAQKLELEDELRREWEENRLITVDIDNGLNIYKWNQSDNTDDAFSLYMFASRNKESQWCTGQVMSYPKEQLEGGDFYIIAEAQDLKPIIAMRMSFDNEKVAEIVGNEKGKISQFIPDRNVKFIKDLFRDFDKNSKTNFSFVLENIDKIKNYDLSQGAIFGDISKENYIQLRTFTYTKVNTSDKSLINEKINLIKRNYNIGGITELSGVSDVSFLTEFEPVVTINLNADQDLIRDDEGNLYGDTVNVLQEVEDIERATIETISEEMGEYDEDELYPTLLVKDDSLELGLERDGGKISLDNIVDASGLTLRFDGFSSVELNNLEDANTLALNSYPNGKDTVLKAKKEASASILEFNIKSQGNNFLSNNNEQKIKLSKRKFLAERIYITNESDLDNLKIFAENIEAGEVTIRGRGAEYHLGGKIPYLEINDAVNSTININDELSDAVIYLEESNKSIDDIKLIFKKNNSSENLEIHSYKRDFDFLNSVVNSNLVKNFKNVNVILNTEGESRFSRTRLEVSIKEDGNVVFGKEGGTGEVKFSLAEKRNSKLSPYMEGFEAKDQLFIAGIIDKAITNIKNATTTRKTFKVPNLKGMTDKEKSFFLISKVAKGYNNFEFLNKEDTKSKMTNEVLENSDVKYSLYEDNAGYNSNLETAMNEIIQDNKGIDVEEKFSPETAKNIGKNIGRYDVWLPPEDEDFVGLLYTLANARGKMGEAQMDFFQKNLIKPYSEAMLNLMRARQAMYSDWKDLINNKYKGITKKLKQDSGYANYTIDQAVRVFLWDYNGFEVPGLNAKDLRTLRDIVRKHKELRDFAMDISYMSKQANGYIEPDHNWGFGSVVGDINNVISKSNRVKYLEHWQHNVDKIFSKDNMSKIEAVYGTAYASSLRNSLQRMKLGTNRLDSSSDAFFNWLNGATGVTMWWNMRSGILQTISATNFINMTDNNIVKAGARMVNFPQFRRDFLTLWNSEYLKDRRSGLMNDVAEAELAQMMNDQRNKNVLDLFKSFNYWLLKTGFTPTRLADSFAIAFGGASFYRNRIETYKKQGLTESEAESKTMSDFYETSEESQQSADTSKISKNQASMKGRLVFAFQNTPLQYGRIMKKAVIDIAKGRGDFKTNMAKILYYGALQNFFFNFMQNALFAALWDDEDEMDEEGLGEGKVRALNSWMDTILKGSGFKGAVISTIKNVVVKWYEKHGDPKAGGEVVVEALNIAPSIGIKSRKMLKAYKGIEYNWNDIEYEGFSLKNKHMLEATATLTSAAVNVPTDRLYQKTINVQGALNAEYEWYERMFMALGYSTWNLGIEEEEEEESNNTGQTIESRGIRGKTLQQRKLVRR